MTASRPRFTIGVVGIIFDDENRVLLAHRRDYDLWNFPGGGLESGESPEAAVIREIKEETGFDAEIVKLLGVYTKTDKDEVVFAFICKITGGQPTLNDEADQIEYFELSKVPHNTSVRQVERLIDALQNPKEVVFKIQNGQSSIDLIKEGKL